MKVIRKHTGKRRERKGITIHLLKQGSKERSKTITVHGLNIDQLYEKLLFFTKALELAGQNEMRIIITKRGSNNSNERRDNRRKSSR